MLDIARVSRLTGIGSYSVILGCYRAPRPSCKAIEKKKMQCNPSDLQSPHRDPTHSTAAASTPLKKFHSLDIYP
ncbi:MAG TPA: hypothetical protein VGG64_24500, partial [Pirellulales bacterium]